MRTIIYIDGFNFYHGCLQNNDSCKWLDLKRFFEALLRTGHKDKEIVKIKYFTTRIRSYVEVKNKEKIHVKKLAAKQNRQQNYLRSLKTLYPESIDLHIGRFSSYPVKWPLANDPFEKVEVMRTEEKMTDVSLATHMVNDAWLDNYDCAILISSDSDMITAIKLIKHNILLKKIAHKELGLITPAVNANRQESKRLKALMDFSIVIKGKGLLEQCQLPETVYDKRASIIIKKPEKWK